MLYMIVDFPQICHYIQPNQNTKVSSELYLEAS